MFTRLSCGGQGYPKPCDRLGEGGGKRQEKKPLGPVGWNDAKIIAYAMRAPFYAYYTYVKNVGTCGREIKYLRGVRLKL